MKTTCQITFFLWIISLIFFSKNLYAQVKQEDCKHILRGKVECQKQKEKLIGATIWITELEKGAATNEKGNFEINNLCAGTYTIKCSYLTSKPETIQITIQPTDNKLITLNFALEHEDKILNTVEVIGEKLSTELSTQTVNQLKNSALEETRGKSLGESLTKIAGVNMMQTGASIAKPVIQGLHSNRILIMNNGVRQEGQQWGAEHAPEIDPFIATQLTVIKGAASVRYGGDAIGGVVLVEPKSLTENPTIGGEINLVGSSNNGQGVVSGIVEGKINKIKGLAWRTQGTLKKAGNVATPDYYLKNTGFQEFNFSYALGYLREKFGTEIFYSQFNTDLGIFSGAHVGNPDDLRAILKSQMPPPEEQAGFTYQINRPKQHVEHELFKLKSYLRFEKIGKLSIIYARQYNERAEYDKHKPLNDSLAALDLPEFKYKITTHTAEVSFEHYPIGNFHGIAGINGITQANTFQGRLFIPNFQNYSGGIFLIEHWEKNKWHFEAGLRYDYKWMKVYLRKDSTYTFNFHNYSGTLGAKYNITNQFVVSANAGMAWRAPAVNELFSNGIHHGNATIEIGDPSLQSETAYNFLVNVNYKSERFKADVTLYNNLIDNYIYLAPDSVLRQTIRGAFRVFEYKQANALFQGADVNLQFALNRHFNMESKVSLIRAFNRNAHDYLILIPADRYENSFTYQPKNAEHSSNETIKNLYFTLSTVSVLKQWRVPANSDYALPPDGYTLLNFESSITIMLGKQPLQLGVGIQNILNTTYRDYMNRFRYFADDMGRNITVRVKMRVGKE